MVSGGTKIPLAELSEIYNPSWSPDGSRIIFSALKGGLSDLFIYTLDGGALVQLTADAYADLHPAWSPDGSTIAFATDRFTTDLEALRFGSLRVGLLELATGLVRPLSLDGQLALDGPPSTKQVSPQWAPVGDAIYFVSDRGGTSNVYRAELLSGELRQVTDVGGGVSGITATSPTLAVAARAGTLAFSVFDGGRYAVKVIDGCGPATSTLRIDAGALGAGCNTPVPASPARRQGDSPQERAGGQALPGRVAPGADLGDAGELSVDPPVASGSRNGRSVVLRRLGEGDETPTLLRARRAGVRACRPLLNSRRAGTTIACSSSRYRSHLSVRRPAMHSAGLARELRVRWHLLKDRQLQTAFRIGTDVDDFAAQMAYTNRKAPWSWVCGGFLLRAFTARGALFCARRSHHARNDASPLPASWGRIRGALRISRARRIDRTGVRRTGFDCRRSLA